MNWDRIEGNWKEFKGKVQQQWGKLTNDDLDVIEGKRVELSGRLQQRYGYAKDEAEREIDTWLEPRCLAHHDRLVAGAWLPELGCHAPLQFVSESDLQSDHYRQ